MVCVLSVLSLYIQPKKCLAERSICMVSVRDALALAGAQQSDLSAILQALEDDRIGHKGTRMLVVLSLSSTLPSYASHHMASMLRGATLSDRLSSMHKVGRQSVPASLSMLVI